MINETVIPTEPDRTNSLFIGYATVPLQRMGATYTLDVAMQEGTLFPELNLPMRIFGREGVRV